MMDARQRYRIAWLLAAWMALAWAPPTAGASDDQDIALITIGPADAEALGGWPLNRKWYALALENLRRAGAERIYIDIAFPRADAAHPESDLLFLHALKSHDDVFLLAEQDALLGDSVAIMGSHHLPQNRFFAPFSADFAVRRLHLVLRDDGREALTRLLSRTDVSRRPLLIRLPDSLPQAEHSFLDAVRGSIGTVATDAVIALDLPGATSYVAPSASAEPLPTSALQVHAARQLRKGAYEVQWPTGLVVLLFLGSLLPLAGTGRRLSRQHWIWISGVLCLAVPAVLALNGIHVPAASFALVVLPVSMLAYVQVRDRRTVPVAPPPTVPEAEGVDRKELDDLRWRMRFYEHLERREPSDTVAEADGGIYFAPGSPIADVLRKARKVAQTDMSVLILGESGAGKELVARYVHDHSHRSTGPFLAINCAAVPPDLIESELFGHEKGSFTGAHSRKSGLFERADGGTLFLDEVSETSAPFQAKLLRVLQDGSFTRVGGSQRLRSSVRVIAATHRDLQKAIRGERFREDLYYRLNGITLNIPPLRERRDDISHLFGHFLASSGSEVKTSPALLEWLREQAWPGNVRELKAATQRAVVNAELRGRRHLLPQDFELDDAVTSRPAPETLADQVLAELRRQQFHGRSISRTAETLSIHRSTVTEYLRGWIIRLLAQSEEDVAERLQGPDVADPEQLERRVERYASGIASRIEEGLTAGETDDEIRLGRFRNLAQEFQEDLHQLIAAYRRRSG